MDSENGSLPMCLRIWLKNIIRGRYLPLRAKNSSCLKQPAGRLICTRDFVVTRRDTDTNGHANNVKYLEWVMDDIPDAIYEDMTLKISALSTARSVCAETPSP